MHEIRRDQVDNRASDPSNRSSNGATRQKPTVLIVDDDLEMLEALEVYLHHCGFKVKTANRGVDGLRCAMDTDFDAILCDMVMPRFPGDMFYLAISKVKPHLCKRFVFITGHAGDPSVAAFIAATQQPVLTKPAGLDHLLGVLQWIIRTNSSRQVESRRMEASPNGRLVLAN